MNRHPFATGHRCLSAGTLLACFGLLVALAGTSTAQVPTTINVEIDFMQGGGHRPHAPSQAVLNALVDMFACHGITLNLWVDDDIPHVDMMQCDDPDNDDFFDCDAPNSFRTMKDLYCDTNDIPGWHYCIMGHAFNSGTGLGRSGSGEIAGNDFIVTMGTFTDGVGTDFEVAATFAHELGHNLGLRHYSPNSVLSRTNFAVNYASVMSYQYQLNGVATRMECLGLLKGEHRMKDLDYSNGRLPVLVEAALSEPAGIGIHPVDWDCDMELDTGPVSRSLSIVENWCTSTSGFAILHDYNDWANIHDYTYILQVYQDTADHETAICMSPLDDPSSNPVPDLDDPLQCFDSGAPDLTTETCSDWRQMVWVDANYGGAGFGIGEFPYNDIATAHALSPRGSVLYLQPGTFTNGGNALVLDRPMVLAGPGGAVLDP